MKVTGIALLGLLGLVGLSASSSFAQEKPETKPEQQTEVKPEQLTEGVTVLRYWKVIKPQWPEIAVLNLKGPAEKEFHRDPKAFVNKYHVFSKPVRVLRGCFRAGKATNGDCCRATTIHYSDSGLA